jgi:exopolysaccharide biosynthesis polyprenyl glycosylphosphotransferase
MRQLSRLSRVRNLELRVAVNLPMVHTPRVAVQTVNDVTALAISPTHITRGQAALKRTFDLAAASIGMLLASPVFAVLAAAIRLTSPGPVLFRQPRVTKDGRIFTVLKFRTMVTDHRAALEDSVIDLSKPFFKLEDDPRLTTVGRFLRKTSLDELPQLINVIRGDMSLVGPRPLPADQVHANPELLGPRHEVRAGVTGWWQVHGRSDVEPEEAVQMDLFYIENWSLSLDLYLILKTLGAVLARRGAR